MSELLILKKRERIAIAVIGVVQFINIVDFMMVMPLGPDFAKALGIKVSHIGVLAGAYTLAAALSGLVCSVFLDRVDRRKALFWSVVGLSIGTGAGAFAVNFQTLLWARVLAGLFGGPTTSVGLAIISDLIPHERRGAAIGKVMLGFSAASIFGVPIGLELAQLGGWNTPFLVIGICALVIAAIVRFALPEMRGHLIAGQKFAGLPLHSLLAQPSVNYSYGLLFFVMMSGFLIFPNIAGYVQMNLKFPREEMGRLYLFGGISSLIVMSFCGRLVDRFGSVPWFIIGSLGFIMALITGIYLQPPLISPYLLFVSFMVFGTMRNISMQTLNSKVPKPSERAGFMSLQSAIQHVAMSCGGILSSRMLTTGIDGELVGLDLVALTSIGLITIACILVNKLAKLVQNHEH